MVVTLLGQQYHVGAFFCGTVHLLMAITKLRSDAFGPGYWDFDGNLCISLSYCRGSCCGSLEYPPDRQGYSWLLPKLFTEKMRKICPPPRHLGEIMLAHVDLFE